MKEVPVFTQPRWVPIGQYRTVPLPMLAIPPFVKRIPYPARKQVKSAKIITEDKI